MIPPLLFRTAVSIPRSDSARVGFNVRTQRQRSLCEALSGLRISVPLGSLALPSVAAWGGIWRSRLMTCFFLLSVADLLLTGWLLGGDGLFVEANPLAAWCLEWFGWGGLASCKAASFLLAAWGISVLARRRPRLAQGTLALGCLAVAVVVFRSVSLAAVAPALREEYRQQRALQAQADAEADDLNGRIARKRVFDERRRRLSREVLAGRCSLESAVAKLAGLGLQRHPDWRRLAETLNPGKSPREILESQLLNQLLADIRDGAPEGERLLARLWSFKLRKRVRRVGRYEGSDRSLKLP